MPSHVLTVVDQAYFEYIDRPDYHDAVERYLKAGHRVAVLRTFSKIYGLAGLRVGYAVAPAARCAAMAKVRRPFDVTTSAQVAAIASIGDERRARAPAGGQRGRARAARADPARARASSLCRRSETSSTSTPAATRPTLFDRLLREGVIVRPLAGFGSPTAIRISVGTPEELDLFAAALGRVLARA